MANKLTKQEKLEIIIKDNTEMIDLLIEGMAKIIRTNHNLIEVLKTVVPNHLLTEDPKLTTEDVLNSDYAIPTVKSELDIVLDTIEKLSKVITNGR